MNELLVSSIETGNMENFKRAIDGGADIHYQDDIALKTSAYNGFLDMVKILVSKGANVHAGDDYPLRTSAQNGFLDIVKYLVLKGANIHADNDFAFRTSKGIHQPIFDFLQYIDKQSGVKTDIDKFHDESKTKQQQIVKTIEDSLFKSEYINLFKENLDKINRVNIKKLLAKNYCCVKTMELISNLIHAVFLTNTNDTTSNPLVLNRTVQSWFTDIKLLSNKSVEGIVLTEGLKFSDDTFVVKYSKGSSSDDLLHEYFIGLELNSLRKYIPTFMYAFGMFKCGVKEKIINKKDIIPISICSDETNVKSLLILEKIDGQPFEDVLKFLNVNEIMEIIIQLFIGLKFANERLEYCHLDLHFKNILIKHFKVDQIVKYPYNGLDVFIKTKNIPIIIDFGFSRVKGNLGQFRMYDSNFITLGKNAPEQDIYRVFTLLIAIMRQQHGETALKIVSIFENMFKNQFSNPSNNIEYAYQRNYYLEGKETKFVNVKYDFVLDFIKNTEWWDKIVSTDELAGYSKCSCKNDESIINSIIDMASLESYCIRDYKLGGNGKDEYGFDREGIDCGKFFFDGKYNVIELPKNFPVYYGSLEMVYTNEEFPFGNYYVPLTDDEAKDISTIKRNIPTSVFSNLSYGKKASSVPYKLLGNDLTCGNNCIFAYKLRHSCKFVNISDPFNLMLLIKDKSLILFNKFCLCLLFGAEFRGIEADNITDIQLEKIYEEIDKNNKETISTINDGISKFYSEIVDTRRVVNMQNKSFNPIRRFESKWRGRQKDSFFDDILSDILMEKFDKYNYSGYISSSSYDLSGKIALSSYVSFSGKRILKDLKRNYYDENDWQYIDRQVLFTEIGKLIIDIEKYKTSNIFEHEGDLIEHSVWSSLFTQHMLINLWAKIIPQSEWREVILTSFLHDIGNAGDKQFLYYKKKNHNKDGSDFISGTKQYLTDKGPIDFEKILLELNLIDKRQEIACLIEGHGIMEEVFNNVNDRNDIKEIAQNYIRSVEELLIKYNLGFNTLAQISLFFNKLILISISDIKGKTSFINERKLLSDLEKLKNNPLPFKFNDKLKDLPFIVNRSKTHSGGKLSSKKESIDDNFRMDFRGEVINQLTQKYAGKYNPEPPKPERIPQTEPPKLEQPLNLEPPKPEQPLNLEQILNPKPPKLEQPLNLEPPKPEQPLNLEQILNPEQPLNLEQILNPEPPKPERIPRAEQILQRIRGKLPPVKALRQEPEMFQVKLVPHPPQHEKKTETRQFRRKEVPEKKEVPESHKYTDEIINIDF
jgi:hypothetical protein